MKQITLSILKRALNLCCTKSEAMVTLQAYGYASEDYYKGTNKRGKEERIINVIDAPVDMRFSYVVGTELITERDY